MIPRYTLETFKYFDKELISEQPVKQQTSGNIVFVNDILERLKELRSEYLSDNDYRRRAVIEMLMQELGASISISTADITKK